MDIQIEKIVLPTDEYDEDDEMDVRIEKANRKKRKQINRGSFFGI